MIIFNKLVIKHFTSKPANIRLIKKIFSFQIVCLSLEESLKNLIFHKEVDDIKINDELCHDSLKLTVKNLC